MRRNSLLNSLLSLTLILTSSLIAQAQNPALYRPVLFFYSGSNLPGVPNQARMDGSGIQTLATTPGNLSWNGLSGPRYFVRNELRAGVTSSAAPNDLVVYDESTSVRTVLTGAQDINHVATVWSKDSQRVVYYGKRYDTLGFLIESGIFAGDVNYAGSTPTGLTDEHLVVPDIASTTDAQDNVTTYSLYLWDWMFQGAGASTRIAYTVLAVTRTSTGAFVVKRFDEYVANVGAPGTTGAATPVRLNISNLPATSGSARFLALASPVDDRIALGTYSASTGRYDIYVVNVPASYTGTSFAATQITNSRSANSTAGMQNIGWSPSGSDVYWDGVPPSGSNVGIYRITSNGAGSQTAVLANKKQYNTLGQIRP